MTTPAVRYKLETPTPLAEYVCRFIFTTLGLTSAQTAEDYHLYYGYRIPDDAIVGIRTDPTAVLWQDLLHNKIQLNDVPSVIPFDLINGIAAFLTDSVNSRIPDERYSAHHHVATSQSFQGLANIATIPVVNLYVTFLGDLLKRRLNVSGVPLLPPGRRYAIGLSHDVDRLQYQGIIKAILYMRYAGISATLTEATIRRGFLDALYRSASDDFLRFRGLLRSEEDQGFVSTFFFSALPLASRYRAIRDILYDIDDDTFRTLFRCLQAQGFEIGLHASYNAYRSPKYLMAEKQRLEQIAQVRVRGLRHHYWHLGKDVLRTLRYHAQAGFEYDSSLSFDDDLGFRRATALPYYPWDAETERPVEVMQLPVCCMDGHLFYRPGTSAELAVERVTAVVRQLKAVGGIGVINWHSDTAHDQTPLFEKWGAAYMRLLHLLAADSSAWVTSLDRLRDWFWTREQRLLQ